MTPGEPPLYRAPQIDFTDSEGDRWLLQFGNYYCSFGYPSPCRVMVTAVLDADGDTYADLWTIEPEPGKHSEAILFKLNKKQQWDVVGSVSVPFHLAFAKEPFAELLH